MIHPVVGMGLSPFGVVRDARGPVKGLPVLADAGDVDASRGFKGDDEGEYSP